MAGRLRELRARHGYSQQGMANLAEVAQSTWSKWEVETPEQFASLGKLARKLETSADYLLCLTDDPTPVARRDEWTPEAIEVVSLVNELPAGKRGAALAVLKAAVELTQAEMLDTTAAPANDGGGVTLASQQAEPPQDNLSEQKDTLLALLQKVLNPKDYEYVVQSVERGQSLTDAEIARLIESNNHKPLPENLELLNNHNAVN